MGPTSAGIIGPYLFYLLVWSGGNGGTSTQPWINVQQYNHYWQCASAVRESKKALDSANAQGGGVFFAAYCVNAH